MPRTAGDIYKIARACNVYLHDTEKHSPTGRKPFDCYCKPMLRDIVNAHGEDHLKAVLMLMTGTDRNAAVLYADTIKATSELLIGWPDLMRRKTLVDDFNKIDLQAFRQYVRKRGMRMPSWQALLVMMVMILDANSERAVA